MNFKIVTTLPQNADFVWEHFNKKLFIFLLPKFPPVDLQRYDGNYPGDEVHLEFNFIFFKQRWESIITKNLSKPDECFGFEDKGKKLPFFIKTWKHQHLIVKEIAGSRIEDRISYTGPWYLPSILSFPVLFLQFYVRKFQYPNYYAQMEAINLKVKQK